MKKVFSLLILVTCMAVTAHSQISLDKVKNSVKTTATSATATVANAGIDVKTVSGNMMTKLTSALKLTNVQEPKVATAVTSFLQSKSNMMSLAATDKTKYTTKLSGLVSDLTTKLKGTLTEAQMAKFQSLKSSKLSASDPLYQLFN